MEQLKVGDKVKILWEKTDYVGTDIYNRNGVIVGEELKIDVSSGKAIKLYVVGGILNDKNTLTFTKEELVKIPDKTYRLGRPYFVDEMPETTKPLEPRDFTEDIAKYRFQEMLERSKIIARLLDDSKITFHKSLFEDMEENVIRKTLPTKVVFDINKRKTTLLFGDKPYKHKVSGIAHESDDFDTASGFFIQLAKHILKDKWQDKMKMWEYLSKGDFNIVKTMIFNFVLTHLKEELGMSFRQLDKLSSWDFKKPLTFEINGIKHTIEVEHKVDKEQLKIIKEMLSQIKHEIVVGETTKIEEEGEIK